MNNASNLNNAAKPLVWGREPVLWLALIQATLALVAASASAWRQTRWR